MDNRAAASQRFVPVLCHTGKGTSVESLTPATTCSMAISYAAGLPKKQALEFESETTPFVEQSGGISFRCDYSAQAQVGIGEYANVVVCHHRPYGFEYQFDLSVIPAKAVVVEPFTQQIEAGPTSFALVQDGSVGAEHLHWSGWGRSVATGTGTGLYRLENVAGYKFKRAAARVVLSGLSGPVDCVYQQDGVRKEFVFDYYTKAKAVVGPRTVSVTMSSPC